MNIRLLSKVCVIFFLYILVVYTFIGVTTKPSEGDSLNYHIPIAKSYLNATIANPENIDGAAFLKYSPGASEGILSVFYFLHIPPNLYNVFGAIVLFVSLIFLGRRAGLTHDMSTIFAAGIVTLTGVVRWMDTQIIDIYLASFFVLSLALLQKPEKKVSYFLKLGIVLGMLMGSKYSGLFFGIVLLVVYLKPLISNISSSRLIALVVPIGLLGAFWYLRNFAVSGNPLYPQGFLFFKDAGFGILNHQVGRVATTSLFGLMGTINALISEYMVWILSAPIVLLFTYKKLSRVTVVGLLCLGIYMFLPSDTKDYIMVSVVRYSYPAVIPFILGIFLLAKKYARDERIAIVTLSNMFFVGFPVVYYPKLLFVFIPLAFFYFKYKS